MENRIDLLRPDALALARGALAAGFLDLVLRGVGAGPEAGGIAGVTLEAHG